MAVSESSSLTTLEQTGIWQRHAHFFDDAWAKLAGRQFTGIRDWEVNYLPDATQPLPVVYYMFSGPDFLYANQFFPNANTYILAGTEPIGPLPDVTHAGAAGLDSILQNLQKSLNSVLTCNMSSLRGPCRFSSFSSRGRARRSTILASSHSTGTASRTRLCLTKRGRG
jgi:hypothetical protein